MKINRVILTLKELSKWEVKEYKLNNLYLNLYSLNYAIIQLTTEIKNLILESMLIHWIKDIQRNSNIETIMWRIITRINYNPSK